MASEAEAWIDLVLRRAKELRRAGVLSIGFGTSSAALAAAQPGDDEPDQSADKTEVEPESPRNAWEDDASYPTGNAPRFEIDDAKSLPDIPDFGDG